MNFERAAGIEAAVAARAAGATLHAGGTSLVDLMMLGVEVPDRVVDIARLDGLAGIEHEPSGGCRIGALATLSRLARDEGLRSRFPALADAVLASASGQLRNAATAGGNLLQRTRCPYFRDPSSACNKKRPGSGCPAVAGHNRDLAILGARPLCIATHPSDMAVALVALDAAVDVLGPSGPRVLRAERFHRLPGERPDLDTELRADEVITAIRLPAGARARRSVYVKVSDRASYAFALVSAAVALDAEGGRIRSCRVVLGSVAHRPWRSHVAEDALIDQALDDEAAFARAGELSVQGAAPAAGNGFKLPLAAAAVAEALTLAARMA